MFNKTEAVLQMAFTEVYNDECGNDNKNVVGDMICKTFIEENLFTPPTQVRAGRQRTNRQIDSCDYTNAR